MKKLKLTAVLILLPLCLGLFGAWELQRGTEGHLQQLQNQQELKDIRPQLESLAAKSPYASVQVDGQTLSAELALSQFGKAENDVVDLLRLTSVMTGLAWGVIALGLLAALVGTLGLIGLAWAGSRAQESRDRLLHTFSRVSRILPYVLVGHIITMAATVAVILAYEGLGIWHVGRMSTGEMKLMLAALMTGLVCLYSIWTVGKQLRVMLHMFEPSPMHVLGQAVPPEQAPALWDFVRELAARLDALVPDHIVLGMTEGFYVTSSEVRLMPSDAVLQGRTLHVPLMYLGLLDSAETRAVIGHELAHFAGADTEYSQRFLPIYDGISRSLGVIADTMLSSDLLQRTILRPAFMLGVHFIESFDHAVNHWSRVRELAADAAGARMAGNAAAASALLRISAIDPVLQQHVWAHVSNATQPAPTAVLPSDLPGTVVRELSEQPLTLAADEMATQLPHPSDTHPSNGERIASLQVAVEEAANRGTRAIDPVQACAAMDQYFADPADVRTRITEDFMTHYVKHDAQVVEQLRTHAQNVTGDVHLHEGARVRGIATLVVFGAIFLIALALVPVALWVPQFAGIKNLFLVVAAVIAVLMAAVMPYSVRMILRARTTALRLTPDHFVFANLKAPVPSRDIADFGLTTGNGTILNLLLEDDAPMPEVMSRSFFGAHAKVLPKKRWVQLQLMQFCVEDKKLKPEALAELIGTYLNAGTARHILQQREERAVSS